MDVDEESENAEIEVKWNVIKRRHQIESDKQGSISVPRTEV